MKILLNIAFCAALTALTGCAQLRGGATAALGVGAAAKPEYAAVLKQIQKAVEGDSRNPVEGFEFEVVYRYRGQVVDASDITREEIFRRVTSGAQIGFQSSGARPVEETATNNELRDRINEILNAAGVTGNE